MTFNSVKIAKWAAPIVSALLPLMAMAQGTTGVAPTPGVGGKEIPVANVTDVAGVFTVLCQVLNWFFILFVIIAILFVIVAAFKYLTAGGDAEKVQGANHALIYAVVAVVVAVLAKAIPIIVGNFFAAGTFTAC